MKSVSDFIWFALFFSSEIGEKLLRGFHENRAKIHANRRTFSQISGGPISELREQILIIFDVLQSRQLNFAGRIFLWKNKNGVSRFRMIFAYFNLLGGT